MASELMEECLSPKQNSGFNKLTVQNAPGGDCFSSTAFGKLPKASACLRGHLVVVGCFLQLWEEVEEVGRVMQRNGSMEAVTCTTLMFVCVKWNPRRHFLRN